MFIGRRMHQGKERDIKKRKEYFIARIFNRDGQDKDEKPEAVTHKCQVKDIQVGVGGMNEGMDQAAASKDQEARTDKKDPAAFSLIDASTKTTGPECPDSNQQTYKSDENLLANMVIQQKLFRQYVVC